VDVGLWYGSTLDLDPMFVESLYDYWQIIKKNIKFSAHIMTLQCPNCVFEVKEKECLSDGLYCLVPPKDTIGQQYNITDAAVLYDALFGRCVYENIKDDPQNTVSYYNFIYNSRKFCQTWHSNLQWWVEDGAVVQDLESMKWCNANQISKHSMLNLDDILQCVDNSFKEPGNNQTDNMLLYQDKLLAEVYGISVHPAITINGQIYKGDLDGEDIFRAICASFSTQFKPLQCLEEYDVSKDLQLHNAKTDFYDGSDFWQLTWTLLCVCALNVCLIYCYKKWQQRQHQ